MRLTQLVAVLATLAAASAIPAPAPAAAAAPGRWRFDDAVAGGGSRQARRIASPAADAVNALTPSSTPSTSTTPAPRATKRLVTLAPGGDSIQDILFNNGYRDRPADAEPQPNNIDSEAGLDGLPRKDVWLLDGNLLVLKGGAFSDGFSDTEPIDDLQAPYRQPRFPPPEFLGEDELPPDLLAAWQYGFPPLPPLGPQRREGYSPYGRPESRPEAQPESVAGPHSNGGATPYDVERPYRAGRTHSDTQPYVDGGSYDDRRPYVDRKPYISDQPYIDAQPYPGIDPYTDKQPSNGDKPQEDVGQPINPELMKGYSPLGRPERRPDTLYETPQLGTPPAPLIRSRPESIRSHPEQEVRSRPEPHNGQSYGERRRPAGGDGRPQSPAAPARSRGHTYSVSTSYSSTSSQSSTSVSGYGARYLPPPPRAPDPR